VAAASRAVSLRTPAGKVPPVTLDDVRRNRNLLFWALTRSVERLPDRAIRRRADLRPAGRLHQGHPGARRQRLPAVGLLRYVYRRLWGRPPLVVIPSVFLAVWVTALVCG